MARYPARCVSLPLESNPIIARITKELKKLKAWEETSTSKVETLTIGLTGISDLYKCVGQFLSLPLTQQALSMHHHGKFVSEFLEGSSHLLEVCGSIRDLASELKEASRDLHSSQMHPLGVSSYFSSRKRITKSAKQIFSSLKKLESKFVGDEGDNRISVVINILSCVNIISLSILESLVSFLGMSVSKPRTSFKFPLLSKLRMNPKGKSACVESWNELESVDLALGVLCCNVTADEEDFRVLTKRLEMLEGGIEGIDNGLDSMVRVLTETRASLLETLSF